jgi:uncharacterized Rmd1/YagE family protein
MCRDDLHLPASLGLQRDEVFRTLGALFKSRVDVNICELLIFSGYSVPES